MWAESYLDESVRKEAQEWVASYLHWDVQRLQEHKQHHVHIYNDETKEKEPLQACRRKDNPKLCKADFPRTSWLIDTAVILCNGLLRKSGYAIRWKEEQTR